MDGGWRTVDKRAYEHYFYFFLVVWGYDGENTTYVLILAGILLIVCASNWIERYVKKRKNGK